MALIEARASARIVRPTSGQLASGLRDLPERVVLGVREGHQPSAEDPVRIFLGTQPEQHRAERIFIWSIEQVRDPSRVYEIYLMKSLRGFDQRGWTTGFTNYRFAIPHFAGRHGRAIYNDVDQIYLADPAELFRVPLCALVDAHRVPAVARQRLGLFEIMRRQNHGRAQFIDLLQQRPCRATQLDVNTRGGFIKDQDP